MNSVCHYCKGESHRATDKPCQDRAYAETSKHLSMAIVCDGHGGSRYFRSQFGAALAVDITRTAVKRFVEDMTQSSFTPKATTSVFDKAPFTTYSAATATEQQERTNAHKALKWLFSHIITQWNQEVAKHARETDLSEWEIEHVEQQYKDEFLRMRDTQDASFEKTYGCTLMAYVQTQTYWFAFHIGDGKCISMRLVDGDLVCEQPIPWDEKCFLNKTTSLCDSNAVEEFRYCYQGDGTFPSAVFLGSDGIDDTFGDGDILNNFYIRLFKNIILQGKEKTERELSKSLPIISQRGSKDDMSVACVYNDTGLSTMFRRLTAYQQEVLKRDLAMAEDKQMQLEQKINDFGDPEALDRTQTINLEYAKKDLLKTEEQIQTLKRQMGDLKRESVEFQNKSGSKRLHNNVSNGLFRFLRPRRLFRFLRPRGLFRFSQPRKK